MACNDGVWRCWRCHCEVDSVPIKLPSPPLYWRVWRVCGYYDESEFWPRWFGWNVSLCGDVMLWLWRFHFVWLSRDSMRGR